MTVLRGHFDGKVLVPDEPVDLPQGRALEIHVREMNGQNVNGTTISDVERSGFPIFKVPTGAGAFGEEDVQRDQDEP